MTIKTKGRAILLAVTAALALLAAPARALDVDFDSLILRMDAYLASGSTGVVLRDRDNDANGIKEADQLGMLSAILAGGSNVSCINATIRNVLTSGYNENFTLAANELVVNISGVGTVNIITQLNGTDPALGNALQSLLAGYLTIADNSTITFVNNLADALIAAVLKGTPQESDTANVQNQITFVATDYRTYGNAPVEPNYIGPQGDIDGDTESNVAEYTDGAVPKTREQWLSDNCITPTLRLVNFTGGGLRISGLTETFQVSTAGAQGTVTYSWRKGTSSNFSVVGTQQNYVINFLTTSSAGSYFCVVSDGVTTRTTPSASLSVTQVPIFFATQPLGTTKNPGSTHTFTVSVQGGAGPGPYSYQWKKGTQNVGTNSPSLTLTNLSSADAGTYRCTVTSNGGPDAITSGGATLNVRQINFQISTQPLGAKRYIGQSHTFTVGVSGGSGNFSYIWKRNGSAFGAPNAASITLNNLTEANAGNYTCTVTDVNQPSNTGDTDPALLEVAPVLQIVQQPAGGTVQIGSLINLTVAAQGGFNPLTYQWRWQGVPIPGQTSSTYSAIALSGFEGAFTCRITDAGGTAVTSDAAQIVLAPEIIISGQPVGAQKYSGASHILSVSASGGEPPLFYQWFKNGNSLGTAGQGTSLVFNALATGDAGLYFCRVSDQANSVRDTDTVELKVADLPAFTQQPQGVALDAGQPLSLSVVVSGGMPPLTYQWRKFGVPILGTNSPTYAKASATTVDAGDYVCRVNDALGTIITSNVATVSVSRPIEITQQPTGAIVPEGSEYTFNITAQGGIGLLTFDWRRDGVSLGKPSQPMLTLINLSPNDTGVYSCRVSDESGAFLDSFGTALTVVGALTVAQQPQDASLFEGDDLSLSIQPGGGLDPYTYQWFKNTFPIDNASESSLSIEDTAVADTGLYQCRVTDALGSEVLSDPAAVLVVPRITITKNPTSVDRYTGGSHTLQVNASGGSGIYTYTWRFNAVPIEGAPSEPNYTLENLQPAQSGFYDCVVLESQGGAAASFPAFVRVRDQISVVSQPVGRVLPLGESHTMRFETAGGFEPVSYQWLKDGDFVVGETTNEITVTANGPEDAGSYECLVFDSVSSIVLSNEAEIVVVQPLALVSGPEGGVRIPGEDFTFSVVVTGGGGTLHYEWYKDDAPLDVPDSPELALTDLTVQDQGNYFCVVSDEAGNSLTTPEAQLQVTSNPISFDDHPQGAELYPGEAFTISVAVSGGTGALSYQWRINKGQGLEDIEGATEPEFTIPSVADSDAGVYRCRVSDEAGQVLTSFPATLTVTPRLSFTAQPQPVFAHFGTSATFSVAVTGGIGTKTFVWLRNGLQVGTGSTLNVTNIGTANAGNYQCIVAAQRDSAMSDTVALTAGPVLQITSTPITVTRFDGEQYVFNVETSGGAGPLLFEWFKNDELVAASRSFVLGPLTPGDAGEYRLVAADGVRAIGGEVLVTLEVLAVEGESNGPIHTADTNEDGMLDLAETLRIIQFYNGGGYFCDESEPDGFGVGTNPEAPLDCPFHASDYQPRDRVIGLSELLRAIQFFRLDGYWYCPSEDTEDNYCAGPFPGDIEP